MPNVPRGMLAPVVFALSIGAVLGGLSVGTFIAAERVAGSPLVTDVPAEPLVVEVSPIRVRTKVAVTYELTSDPGMTVVSGEGGVLTWVNVVVGDRVATGSTLAQVNDRPIVGMVSPRPLYRSLELGDEGRDVLAVERFLLELGVLADQPDTVFDFGTAEAVNAFNRRYSQPSSAGTFDMAAIAWLGSTPLRVAKVNARPGNQIQPGEPLVTGPPRPVAVTVVEPESGIASTKDGHKLRVGSVSTPYVAGSGKVSEVAGVRRIAQATPASGEGTAEVVSASVERIIRVPASSVVADSNGKLCVFESPTSPPIQVDPIRGQFSVVELAALTGLTHVLVNPAQTRKSAACG